MIRLVRLLMLFASVASLASLGCSAADSGSEGVPAGNDWRGDPGIPLPGGTIGGPIHWPSHEAGGAGGAGGGAGGTGGGTVADCPEGVICVDSLPFTDTNSTVGGSSTLDGYGCAPDVNESGPEKVYRLDLASEGLLVASLDGLGAGVDVDVHILRELDSGMCIDRGHWDAAALLAPGRFWIVVDSWVDGSGTAQSGNYQLTLALTRADSHQSAGLTSTVLGAGLSVFARAWASGQTEELEYGIIDYTTPSIDPRFFVLDLRQADLLFAEMAAHGSGSQDPSDPTLAANLSNVDGSHASSLGLVRTAETYSGSNGYSLRLDGLEPGFNDHDRSRAIVVHGADYATQAFVNTNGYLGRSWGCPAIDPVVTELLIDTLKDGRLLLKYFDDSAWLNGSAYL